jgi:serine/threonine-protein kinase
VAVPETRVGDYELWARIGTGSTGAVWKAYRRRPVPRIVALKRLRAAAGGRAGRARLEREAAVLTELDHPNIVRIVEVVEDGDGVAIVMELAAGGSLDALLAEAGRLAPGEVVAVAAPIADALSAAHRRGIVHGDVKAANILFAADGRPLLADFDVARALGQLSGDQVAGTAEYLAPELLEGAPPDRRSDIYSLAVVCYEALTGYAPYAGAVDGRSARVPDLGPLADTVERAMARDPRHRFASADAFARALREAVPPDAVGLPWTPAPATGRAPVRRTETFGPRPPRPEARPARWRVRTAVAAVGVAAAALLLWAVGVL